MLSISSYKTKVGTMEYADSSIYMSNYSSVGIVNIHCDVLTDCALPKLLLSKAPVITAALDFDN